ncbi:MAG: carotenoid biosynthesis protein [Candidatus Nitrohelix vancouverensis]|uniref:Carotenoid biosynthesis protein n=1 Tax=Candidatus Nitrohelix vancouverensis TaxID=2705534 RepID=A0A7T0C1W3_9BACT|nr:MAG: carotenoid biosynthesis protein [Candidatus Nitrohelix vancouverensis]
MEILSLLWGTVLLRPYVFAFLATYLIIAVCHMGWRRSLLFTVMAYCIAFLSEYSSTRNGFPYGFYSYIDTTRDQELWISNVPFMDSLSYSFLAFIGYSMALFMRSQLKGEGWDLRIKRDPVIENSLPTVFLGALFFMLMDVVIDPVAFQGDRWFLGKIYTYQEEGEYFNIPLTNFAGWFIVGSAILFCFTRVNRRLSERWPLPDKEYPFQALWGPALYLCVLAFNLAVTFYIGEMVMGLCGLGWTAAILGTLFYKINKTKRPA